MNIFALVFWAILGISGYLIAGSTGALVGILIGLTISLIATVITMVTK